MAIQNGGMNSKSQQEATSSGSGRATLVTAETQLSFVSEVGSSSASTLDDGSTTLNDSCNRGYVFHTYDKNDSTGWILFRVQLSIRRLIPMTF
ncbi:hypothetical protein L3X38_008197 [Prunus dulcis]|uniref:Uncharacterized protein n=1 Tax=Prunus dulcis TaxID=3755 RepID=A0AAD4ZW50_PRUDU|nr:hypothetical protein L3X38_008197 [Prunus dulcis]